MKILDGGVGRELERRGAPFRQPEWSALALWEAPEIVKQVHIDFINACAEVITTNNYAVVPFHIGQDKFNQEAKQLISTAIQQAKLAVEETKTNTQIAGSLPPLFGSYRADLFDQSHVAEIAVPIIETLSPDVDLWLAETQSCLQEVEMVHNLVPKDGRPYWVSFTLQDNISLAQSHLRSGETLIEAAKLIQKLNIDAVLFNCCQPEVILQAIHEMKQLLPDLQVGAYANAFAPQDETATANDGIDAVRTDLDPNMYLNFAKQWQNAGASLIGGCCGISPAHIKQLSIHLKE